MAASRKLKSPDLVDRVASFLAARDASIGHRLAVGLSGGCDSVVLLHLLSRLSTASPLTAVHVHHGLSLNADAWAGFCLDYCRQLGVPCDVQHVRVERQRPQGLEAAAREARYAAFGRLDADTLFLAQHLDDQAETVLLNLLRGAGVAGLAGMAPVRMHGRLTVIRPFLEVTRREIEAYARAHQLSWIEDESNADTHLTRNFLRHEVLTAIGRRFPAAPAMLAQAASHCAEAGELLDDLAVLDWARCAQGEALGLRQMRQLSLARGRNLIRHRLRQLGWRVPVSRRLDEFVRQLHEARADRHPELVLPDGVMRAGRGLLHWIPEN